MNNRRNDKRPKAFNWIGDMSAIGNFLNEKSWCSPWGIIKILNTYFRALGVVAFACNPFTGILIFCGTVLGNSHVAIAGVMCSIISTLTCKLMKASDGDICSGLNVFNSILVGNILTTVLPPLLNIPLDFRFWIIVAFAAFLVNFVDQGLQTMMAPSRLPVQSVPFNIIAALAFLLFRAQTRGFELEDRSLDTIHNQTVEWEMVFKGTICAAGEVFGVGNLTSSILVWLGWFLYSPLLTVMFYVGSVIGAVLAVLYNVRPLAEIYAGLWSFNSLLAAGGITFFVVPTPLGILLAMVNATLAVTVQAALTPLFMQTTVPVFSYPFNVAIMFVLAISLRKGSAFKYVEKRTFPEEHLLQYYGVCDGEIFDDGTVGEPLRIMAKV